MTDDDRTVLADQLQRVIAWEVQAQLGVRRAPEKWPALIADTLLDYFDVHLKPGADISGFA